MSAKTKARNHPLLDVAFSYQVEKLPGVLIACRWDTKRPYGLKWNQASATDLFELSKWFVLHPDAVLGMTTGKASGVWCLDIDFRHGGKEIWDELIAEHGSLPLDTPWFNTPNGIRIFFRWEPGVYIRTVSNQFAPGIDTRGHREDGSSTGQTIIPPSKRPDGSAYWWPPGFSQASLRNARPAPDWVLYPVGFSKKERASLEAVGITGPEGFEGAPRHEWRTLMLAKVSKRHLAGERKKRKAPGTVELHPASYALSPGEIRKISAYVTKTVDAVCAELREAPPGEQDAKLNNVGLRINGLLQGAAYLGMNILELEAASHQKYIEACIAMKAGPSANPLLSNAPWMAGDAEKKWDHASADATTATFPDDIFDAYGFGPVDDKPSGGGTESMGGPRSPDMSILDPPQAPAPVLPLEVFGPFASWIRNQAEGKSAPPDYVTSALLGTLGALVGATRRAQVDETWSEPCVIWCASIGEPGWGKSPAHDSVFDLLQLIEREMARPFPRMVELYKVEKLVAKTHRDLWEASVKAAVKDCKPVPSKPPEAHDPPAPVCPSVRVEDTTIEALIRDLAGWPRGFLLQRDEMAGWLGNLDKYGGGGGERAQWVEMFGGRSGRVSRIAEGRSGHVPFRHVSIVGGIQPERLQSMLVNTDDDGLLARFLPFYPERIALKRSTVIPDNTIVQHAFARLAALEFQMPCEPVIVHFTAEAREVMWAWRQAHHTASADASGKYASALNKCPGYVARLALILELAWWSAGEAAVAPATISADAVKGASHLVENYFKPMIDRMLGSVSDAQRYAQRLAKAIVKKKCEVVNVRDIKRFWNIMPDNRVDAAVNELIEAGWLTEIVHTGPGRPPKDFRVHPDVIETGHR